MNGIAKFAYNRDSPTAQKLWFFFEAAIICASAGISSDLNKKVNTTVNQSFLKGDIQVKEDGQTQIFKPVTHNLTSVQWVIHNKWAYFFPEKSPLKLTNRTQTGNWNNVLKRIASKKEKANIFTLCFNHAARPQAACYAYYVFPTLPQVLLNNGHQKSGLLRTQKSCRLPKVRKII
jgi:chondroitin AC lyase